MITTDEEFNMMCSRIVGCNYVAIDTESNGEEIRDGRGYAMGISIATDTGVVEYLPFRHRFGENLSMDLIPLLELALKNAGKIIFHNAKFDLVSLKTLGIDLFDTPFYDTMLMAHMINENWQSKALDWLGRTLLKEGKARGEDFLLWRATGWGNTPEWIMRPYAEQDAALTLKLFLHLYPEFKSQDFDGDLWLIEQEFIYLIIKMENNGIRIDQDLCAEQSATGRARMAEINATMGFDIGKTSQLSNYLLNILNFPVVKWTQVDPETGQPTETSKPSFDKFAMEIYDSMLEELGSDDAKMVTEYRGWQKACAGSYEGYPTLLSPDGRLRPNYKLHGTVTGRLSCEKPNLQQIPRSSAKPWNGALKACFIPRPGYKLYEADYAQLELRLGAAYANVQSLLDEFDKPDSDVFTRMAAELGFSRTDTKTLTYTLQYGGGIKRIKAVFGVDAIRAASIRDNYFATYPGFRSITQRAAAKAVRTGHVKYWSGRRRHFDNPQKEGFKAFNSVIQGGSAEIVKRAMLRLNARGCNNDDCRMLLQVHDSVVFELRDGCENEYRPRIIEAMTDVPEAFGVKFAVDFHEWGK